MVLYAKEKDGDFDLSYRAIVRPLSELPDPDFVMEEFQCFASKRKVELNNVDLEAVLRELTVRVQILRGQPLDLTAKVYIRNSRNNSLL